MNLRSRFRLESGTSTRRRALLDGDLDIEGADALDVPLAGADVEEQGSFGFGVAVIAVGDHEDFAVFADLAEQHAAVLLVVDDAADFAPAGDFAAVAAAVAGDLEAAGAAVELPALLRPNVNVACGVDGDLRLPVHEIPGIEPLALIGVFAGVDRHLHID